MPNQNSLDALKKLLGGSSDLSASDPKGMIHARLKQEDLYKEMSRTHDVAKETGGMAGSVPSDFADLASTLNESPNFGVDAQARAKGFSDANDKALAAGFTGDEDIAGPATDTNHSFPQGEHLYANVGDRSPMSPSARASRAGIAAAIYKEDAPVREAQAKAEAESRGRMNLNRQTYQMLNEARGGQHPGQMPPSAAPQTPQTQTPPPTAPPAAPRSSFQQLKDFVTGGGPTPYNGLSDYLNAKGSKALTGVAATPETSAIQENLLGNAQSLAGIFPSSRAAGVLSRIAQEFQSNYGSETPASSYTRMKNQISALDNAEAEFDDPSYTMKVGSNGMIEPAASNQTIQRAKIAVQTSRSTLQRALQQMEQLHPGIGGSGAPGAARGGRFTRIE